MTTRPAIVHLVIALALAFLAWGPVSVCAADDVRPVCSGTTIAAPDVETTVVFVDRSATPDSRSADPTLAVATAPAGAASPLPPSAPFASGREAGAAPGAAPLFLIHCAFLC